MAKTIIGRIGKTTKIAGFSGNIYLGRELKMLEYKEFGDVVLIHPREARTYKTNIPRLYTFSGEDAWGYSGTGAQCLAQNILQHFLKDEKQTKELAMPFIADVISKLPLEESCVLHKEFIEAWIKDQKDPNRHEFYY